MRYKNIKYSYKYSAFTLIELLVVISIMGILLALSVFGMQEARKSARDGKRKADLEQIRSAIEMYKADCGKYPLTAQVSFGSPLVGSCPSPNTYSSLIPKDSMDPARSYSYSSDGITYTLCASLEQGGTSVTCGSNCGAGCNYKIINP